MRKSSLYKLMAAISVLSSCENGIEFVEPGEMMTFTASMESTKTSIVDGINIYWTSGDQINLYSTSNNKGVTFTTSITSPAAAAEFTGTGADKTSADLYVALYPGEQVYKMTDGYAYYFIPHEQTAVKDNIPEGGLALYAQSTGTTDLKFMHCNAYLKFTIGSSSQAVRQITVNSISGTNISGCMKVENASRDLGTYTSQAVYSDVILSSPDDEALESGTYYIALKPMTYSEGLEFTFLSPDGKIASRKLLAPAGGVLALGAGDVMDLGTIANLEFKENKYALGMPYENGTDKGVIFWIDPANPTSAKIVSAWSAAQKFYEGTSWGTALASSKAKFEDDASKCIKALKGLSVFSTNTWAFMECENNAAFAKGGWYMPCRHELKDIYDMYCGFEQGTCRNNSKADVQEMEKTDDAVAERARIDALMESLGGVKFSGNPSNYIWSCTLNGDGNKVFADPFNTYNPTTSTFDSSKMIRCVKLVSLE